MLHENDPEEPQSCRKSDTLQQVLQHVDREEDVGIVIRNARKFARPEGSRIAQGSQVPISLPLSSLHIHHFEHLIDDRCLESVIKQDIGSHVEDGQHRRIDLLVGPTIRVLGNLLTSALFILRNVQLEILQHELLLVGPGDAFAVQPFGVHFQHGVRIDRPLNLAASFPQPFSRASLLEVRR
jgi:hypothetical protein